MTPLRIFVSSVQKELATERSALSEYLRRDALLSRFFEAFLFEEMPAADHRADFCYLDEVRRCDIYLGIIERMRTGIRDMIDRCRAAGLPEPEIRLDAGSWVTTIRRKPTSGEVAPQAAPQATPQVTPQVEKLLGVPQGEMSREQIMNALALKDRKYVTKDYLRPAVEAGVIEMTSPDKPRSPLQKYRLTAKGLETLKKKTER